MKTLEGIPFSIFTDPNFHPEMVEILGEEIPEEPLVEFEGGWVHSGRGKVVMKFTDDNHRICLTPKVSKEIGQLLIKHAAAIENTK